MNDITVADIVRATREVAAERPDFVYVSPLLSGYCVYTHNGEPSCLFGHALLRLGLPMSCLEELSTNVAIATACRQLNIPLTDGEARSLADVQHAQDNGVPWGEAIGYLPAVSA